MFVYFVRPWRQIDQTGFRMLTCWLQCTLRWNILCRILTASPSRPLPLLILACHPLLSAASFPVAKPCDYGCHPSMLVAANLCWLLPCSVCHNCLLGMFFFGCHPFLLAATISFDYHPFLLSSTLYGQLPPIFISYHPFHFYLIATTLFW